MNSGLVYLRPSRLAYVRVIGAYQNSMPKAWETMLGWLERHGLNSSVGRGYGMMRDNPSNVGAENCRYDACVDLNPFFEERAIRELGAQTLPGGSYVRLRKIAKYDGLQKEVLSLYTAFDAPQGLRLDDRRPLITIYLEDPRRYGSEDLRSDVCIPVTATAKRATGSDLEAA